MKNKVIFPVLVVLMLVATACGSAAPTSASAGTPALPAANVTVNVGQDAKLGKFLVDSAGMTLYLYTKDTPGVSNCYNSCATAWPPLLVNGSAVAGTGVTASLLGTTTRKDGSIQVTYNGWPLYYFANDKAAGDVTGEGVQNVWYVISPDGKQV